MPLIILRHFLAVLSLSFHRWIPSLASFSLHLSNAPVSRHDRSSEAAPSKWEIVWLRPARACGRRPRRQMDGNVGDAAGLLGSGRVTTDFSSAPL